MAAKQFGRCKGSQSPDGKHDWAFIRQATHKKGIKKIYRCIYCNGSKSEVTSA